MPVTSAQQYLNRSLLPGAAADPSRVLTLSGAAADPRSGAAADPILRAAADPSQVLALRLVSEPTQQTFEHLGPISYAAGLGCLVAAALGGLGGAFAGSEAGEAAGRAVVTGE